MSKPIIVLGTILIAVLFMVVFSVALFSHPSSQAPTTIPSFNANFYSSNTSAPRSNAGATATSTAAKLVSIATVYGSTIQTKDFLMDPVTVPDPLNAGQYYIGPHFPENNADASASPNPPYVIDFIQASQFFNIVLYQEPIAATRQQAEQFLMDHLGITKDQMCQLKYMVSVPSRVNAFYAGTSLGFSFCQGATLLPG